MIFSTLSDGSSYPTQIDRQVQGGAKMAVNYYTDSLYVRRATGIILASRVRSSVGVCSERHLRMSNDI